MNAKEFSRQAFIDILLGWHSEADPQKLAAPYRTVYAACLNISEQQALTGEQEDTGIETSLDPGSAVRTVPLGLYYRKPEEVVTAAIESSGITHSNELAVCSAVATAYITHLALNGVPPGIWANELVKVNYSTEFKKTIKLAAEAAGSSKPPKAVLAELGGGQTVDGAVAFALYSCMRHPRYELAVALAVSANAPGAAAIAGAWSGARQGVEAVPESWASRLVERQRVLDQADLLWRAKHGIPNPEKKDQLPTR
jgi:ADP-ribosylglycohydrolase